MLTEPLKGLDHVVWAKLSDPERAALLRRPAISDDGRARKAAEAIIAEVRAEGDAAVRRLTAQFDDVDLETARVSPQACQQALAAMDPADRQALALAIGTVRSFHAAQARPVVEVETLPGIRCRLEERPIEKVGLYVPAGSAALVSTVVMLAVPAKVAGSGTRVLVSPPGPDGSLHPAVLAAAALTDVTDVFAIGGAQAIAALAYGTETVPAVDKIFGPGNAYVTAAKMLVASDPAGAAVDLPAGPSEVLVIADDTAGPVAVAADLLSQAEHDPLSQVLLVSPSAEMISAVQKEVARQLATLPRRDIAAAALASSRAIEVQDLNQAVAVSNAYAPEHLIISCRNADALVATVAHAGSVFVGPHAAEALGDYASGTNHVLPTYGAARAHGGVSLQSFKKTMTVQSVSADGLRALGPAVARLARLEELEAHAQAIDRRLALLP